MGFELLRAPEQFGAASAALVHAFGLGVGVLTDERALSAGPTQHVELLRVEFLAPLVVAELHARRLLLLGSHASTLAPMAVTRCTRLRRACDHRTRGCGGVTHSGSIPSSKRFSALVSR